jgi:hypothetical protein
MKKVVLASLAVTLAMAVPIAAAANTRASKAPKPHIIGTWPNDVALPGSGGYIVWSNGRIQAMSHAPNYGSLRLRKPVNDIVGFAADGWGAGPYCVWLIAANGAVYSVGHTCVDEHLVGPKDAPKEGVVGAVNPVGTLNGAEEGFVMVTSSGRTYRFTCQFVIQSGSGTPDGPTRSSPAPVGPALKLAGPAAPQGTSRPAQPSAVNPVGFLNGVAEGFVIVTASGRKYRFTCVLGPAPK